MGGGAAQLLGQGVDHRAHAQMKLLHPPRHPNRPALVPEVPLQLADDGGGGEGRELQATSGVEALDRLEKAEQGHLDQVLDGFAPVLEAPGEVLGQTHLRAHDLVPQGAVAGGGVLLQLAAELVALGRLEGHA
jgi:hypothetical protein